jgi:hypothetical protein
MLGTNTLAYAEAFVATKFFIISSDIFIIYFDYDKDSNGINYVENRFVKSDHGTLFRALHFL